MEPDDKFPRWSAAPDLDTPEDMEGDVAGAVRLCRNPRAEDALAWLGPMEGAIVLVVTTARGCAVQASAKPGARGLLEQAVRRAEDAGAARALAWQAEGCVERGAPLAIVAAAAAHRKDALHGAALLLDGLKGVAERKELAKLPRGS